MTRSARSRLLLDTHVVLWWFGASPRLPPLVRAAIEVAPSVNVSTVTPWEIAIKVATGRLEVDLEALGDALAAIGTPLLATSVAHAIELRDLPPHHRDPFDRMLVAQARVEGLTLVSADRALSAYDVPVLRNG